MQITFDLIYMLALMAALVFFCVKDDLSAAILVLAFLQGHGFNILMQRINKLTETS